MAFARRCSNCSLDWPDSDEFETCPVCEDEDGTRRFRGMRPMDDDEARCLANDAKFERFYESWDANHDPARLIPGEAEDALVNS